MVTLTRSLGAFAFGRELIGLPRALRLVAALVACWVAVVALSGCDDSASSPGAPVIGTQPAAVTVADGTPANFTVTATGDAPLAYQWRRDGIDLVDGAGTAGATSAALSLSAQLAFSGSQISVRVSNGAGSTDSSDALLTVTAAAPSILTQPANAEVPAGAAATFSVTIAGGTAPVTYQWKRNGTAIAGATAASYTTAPTVIGDSGATFAVDLVNPVGTLTSTSALLTVSTGNGWGAPVLISSGNALGSPGRPDVAIDAAGNAIAVWREQIGSTRNAAWASRYVAGGAWSTAATIDNAVGSALPPRIALTPSGTAVASFGQSSLDAGGVVRLFATRFTGTWAAPQVIDTSDQTPPDEPRIALAPDGTAMATFLQSDGAFPRVWATPSTATNAWGPPAMLDAAGGAFPEVTLAANGHAVVTWVESQGPAAVALWASRDAGAGWSAPVRVSPDTGLCSRSVRVVSDPNGNVIAVWSQVIAAVRTVRSARMTDTDGVWSAPVSLSGGTNDAYGEDVAIDTKGNAVVIWNENGAGIFANRFTSGAATWSGPANIAKDVTPLSVSAEPRVAIDGNGNALAVWLQIPTGTTGKRVYAAHATAAGWGTPFNLMVDPNATTDEAAVIAVNADGEATAVWKQTIDAPFAVGIWARGYR